MASIDPGMLGRWFDAYSRALALYARQWADPGTAEDVVQEVFVRLASQRIPPERVKPWLFRSVKNAAISRLRSRRRRRAREDRICESTPGWFEDRPEGPVDAETVQRAMESLPEGLREVVVLRIWCEMPLKQIAEVVDKPVSTVFSQYKAGLESIRKQLELSCKTRIP